MKRGEKHKHGCALFLVTALTFSNVTRADLSALISPDAVKEILPKPKQDLKRIACLLSLRQIEERKRLRLDGQWAIYGGRFGHTTLLPGAVGWEFIDYAGKVPEGKGLILDIGSAFSTTTRMVAKGEWNSRDQVWSRPPRSIIAIDRIEMNLDTLFALTPEESRERITAWKGSFPELPLQPESVSAANLGSLLHFFPGPRIDSGLKRLFGWMKPGGKVFIEAQTPFLKSFASFLPTYHARVAEGARWPGWISNVGEFVPERAALGSVNLMDKETLRRALEDAGFIVEKIDYFWRHNYPRDLAGSPPPGVGTNVLTPHLGPSIGVVARKPWPWERRRRDGRRNRNVQVAK